jgi:hypothetical protein
MTNSHKGPYLGTALLAIALFVPTGSNAQIGGRPGAFSRMGFGARGIGMGNALSAVTEGDVVGYYNPALLPWMETRHAQVSYGILSFDRTLNFVDYSQSLPPSAGLSIGIINAGVHDIDGRDADGVATGPLRTSENQAFLGFAVRFPAGFSVGLNIKLYYYHLYTDISSTTVGLDVGALYKIDEHLTIAATVRDINSKYKWDTSSLYGQEGQGSIDNFPQLYIAGISYRLGDSLAVLSGEVQFTNVKTIWARFGVEVPVIREITVRGGVDRIDLKEKGNGVAPAVGLTARKNFDRWTPALSYAYVFEPFATSGIHFISLAVTF